MHILLTTWPAAKTFRHPSGVDREAENERQILRVVFSGDVGLSVCWVLHLL